MKRIGLPDNFIQHGSRDEILKTINLDGDGIAEYVEKLLSNKKSTII